MARDRKIVENQGVPEYATYADLPQPANFSGIVFVQNTKSLHKSDGVAYSAISYGESAWAAKPDIGVFGKGQLWFNDIGAMGYSDGKNWTPSQKPVRATPVKVALFGDSTATTGTYTANDNCEIIDLAFPASGNTDSSVTSTRYMMHMEYPCARLARNCGVAGETLAQMLARDAAVASATRKAATDLNSASVDVIIFRGGINSITPLTTYTQVDIDNIVAEYKAVLSRLVASGAVVIAEGVAGYTIEAGGTTAQIGKKAVLVAVNNAIQSYIASLNNANVRFLNPIGITCEVDGTWITKYSSDGVHCEIGGQISLAKAEARVLSEIFGPSAKIQYPGTNLSPNPVLHTTTSVAAGTLATGFTLPVADAWKTVTLARVELINGIPMQTCVVTQNGAGANSITFGLPITLADLNVTSGDVFGMEFDYFIQKLDGTNLPPSTPISSLFSIKKVSNGTVRNIAMSYTTPSTGSGMSLAQGHITFNKFKINEAQANLETPIFQLVYYPPIAQAIAANAVKIGVGGVRIVKL